MNESNRLPIENKFKTYSWFILGGLLFVSLFLGFHLKNTKMDMDFEKLFSKGDLETEYYKEFRAKFKSENDYLLFIIERKTGIFDSNFLANVNAFSKDIESIKNIKSVTSITNQNEFRILHGGTRFHVAYIDFKDFDPQRDSTRIYQKEELVGSLVSKDAKSLCVFIKHSDYLSKSDAKILIRELKRISHKHSFESTTIFGRSYAQNYIMEKMSFEMILFLILSAILIILFLFIAFKSVWGILIPQIVVFGSMIWLLGGMGLFNQPISILLTVMPSIMFVVSMSDVIHLVSRYLDALREEESNYLAIMTSIKEVGLATLLTSITTAIGFFSLYLIPIEPFQKFGIIMGCGVLIAFVLTFSLLPILFYWFPCPKRVKLKYSTSLWTKKLTVWFEIVVRNPKQILLIAFGVCLLSVLGIAMMSSNNYMMDDLPPNDPLKKDLKFISDQYGGSRPFTMTVDISETAKEIWDLEVLREIDTIQTYLEKNHGVHVRSSLITALKVMNRGANSGNPQFYQIPASQKKMNSFKKILKIVNHGLLISEFMDSAERTLQINGFLDDVGNNEISARNIALNSFIEDQNTTGIKYTLTGTSHLVDKNLRSLVHNMLLGLIISILIIAFILGCVFMSIKIALISLVPNLMPLIILAGIMGFMGIEIKMSTGIVFSIAFGIVVDDTIHFLGKFKHELNKGKLTLEALRSAYLTTGKAMVLTTLILCSGFCLMIFSSFMGTFYLGFLLTTVLLMALISDLTVLPILLLLFYKSDKRRP